MIYQNGFILKHAVFESAILTNLKYTDALFSFNIFETFEMFANGATTFWLDEQLVKYFSQWNNAANVQQSINNK